MKIDVVAINGILTFTLCVLHFAVVPRPEKSCHIQVNIMKLKKQVVIRYSEAFKQEVVAEIESGRMNRFQASKRFGVTHQIISYWLKRMGKLDVL